MAAASRPRFPCAESDRTTFNRQNIKCKVSSATMHPEVHYSVEHLGAIEVDRQRIESVRQRLASEAKDPKKQILKLQGNEGFALNYLGHQQGQLSSA